MTGRIFVRRPGLLTTVQDLGRPGLGRFGVSPSGAMDPLALRVANRLVGNTDGAPALEITGLGPELEFGTATLVALAGGRMPVTLNGRAIEHWRSFPVFAGDLLAFRPHPAGGRCYLGVTGGLAAPVVLGSASTDVESGIGGHEGRPLQAGDVLTFQAPAVLPAPRAAGLAILGAYAPGPLRLVPEAEPGLPAGALSTFLGATWQVSPRSNRMGYRLAGPPLPRDEGDEPISEPIPPGTVQVTHDGLPVLLMADRPTIGGYPRLGCVIAADIPRAAQLWIGEDVCFCAVSAREARAALIDLEAALAEAVPR